MLSTLINELTCGHWTTVVFIELLVYIELTKKLICTCSPTLVLTKGTKAHQRKVSSARLIIYTAHFTRAGLDFQDHVPVLSMLGLPLDMVRARMKFWSSTDGPKSFTWLNLSAHIFHPSRVKNFRPCKWGLNFPQKTVSTHWDFAIGPIAKSTSPRLSYTTFFACWFRAVFTSHDNKLST